MFACEPACRVVQGTKVQGLGYEGLGFRVKAFGLRVLELSQVIHGKLSVGEQVLKTRCKLGL